MSSEALRRLSMRRGRINDRLTVRLALLATVALFLGTSCGGTTEGTEDAEKLCHSEKATEFASAPVTQADIYLDSSESMQGYLSDATHAMPVSPLQQLLQSLLLEELNDLGVVPGFYPFGSEVPTSPSPLSHLQDFVRSRGSYSQRDTDIVAALERASGKESSLSVVITDNTQDLETFKERRAFGFDRSGIVRAVTGDLAGKGFGVWLLGVQSPFDGVYYSVLLTRGPAGVVTNQRITLQQGSERPFYCWVVSRDWEKGRRLVARLHEDLERYSGLSAGSHSKSQVIEFFPGILPSLVVEEPEEIEVSHGPGDQQASPGFVDIFRVRSWTHRPMDTSMSLAELDFEQPRSSEILFPVKVRLSINQDDVLLSLPLQAWKSASEGNLDLGARLTRGIPHFEVKRQQPVQDSSMVQYLELSIPYERLVSQPRDRWKLAIPLSISVDMSFIGAENWLGAWSTQDDTSPKAISGKTLYLRDVSTSILQKTVGRSRYRGCLSLNFERK
ncbi:MAG: hypothetical protein WAM82_22900 [Thermoanaerobaculia bacterium]